MNNLPEAWYTLTGANPTARRQSLGNAQAAYLKRFGAFPSNPRLFRVGRTIYIGYPLPEPEEPEPEELEYVPIPEPAIYQLTLGV